MDKEVLIQYCELMEEIKDIRRRIRELDRFLEHPPIVADTVKGSRRDLTIGPIKVTGIPDPVYCRKQKARERYGKLLAANHAGRRIHRDDPEFRAEDYVPAVFHRWPERSESCRPDESDVPQKKKEIHG